MDPTLHFDGPVWRPPYEATSQLLQVTAGCTWHRCKFCTLYGTHKFRLSPLSEIEHDLRVIHAYQPRAHRIFLTEANPFVLAVSKLIDIALLIRKYVGEGRPTIGCFARITDIRGKSVEELRQLRHLGFDYLTIGVESGDRETLGRVNKVYTAGDIGSNARSWRRLIYTIISSIWWDWPGVEMVSRMPFGRRRCSISCIRPASAFSRSRCSLRACFTRRSSRAPIRRPLSMNGLTRYYPD